ncbi:MAG: biotin-dependent carboxylase-like uncharacterized protein [Saprospiraceae bacterium]
MIEIIKPGLYTSIQDQGRNNCSHLGVPNSGAMDSISASDANRMLDNDPKASVIECTIIGPEIKFHKTTSIAITGAVIQPFINGVPSFINKALRVKSGDILSFGKIVNGARFYIAVRGGFLGSEMLGSQSTCITSSIFNILQKRDHIEFAEYDGYFEQPPLLFRNVGSKNINVLKGPEFELIKRVNPNLLDVFKSSFVVRQESNRMAYRISHDLNLTHDKSIISSGTIPGTIQLTPNGDMIFLMRDAQTTGGYPRVLQLTGFGICDLAQMKVGENFHLIMDN